jgi:hypothetical protein
MPGYRRAVRTARRLYPLLLEAYRRWDRLTPAERERYKKMARQYARRGTDYAKRGASYARRRRR